MLKKFLFSVTLLSVAASAMAADINNPLYLPATGEWVVQASYDYREKARDIYSTATNDGAGWEKYQTHEVRRSVQYGVADQWTLEAGFSSALAEDMESLSGNTNSDEAFYNPYISANYRWKDGSDKCGMVVDFFGGYQHGIDEWSTASSTYDGQPIDAYRGQQLWFGAQAGKDLWEKYTLVAFAQALYHFESDTEIMSTGIDYEASDAWDYTIGLKDQYRFNDKFSMNGELSYSDYGNHKSTRKSNGVYRDFKGGESVDLMIQANYNITTKTALSLFGGYSYILDTSVYDSATPSANYAYRNDGSFMGGVAIKHLF